MATIRIANVKYVKIFMNGPCKFLSSNGFQLFREKASGDHSEVVHQTHAATHLMIPRDCDY